MYVTMYLHSILIDGHITYSTLVYTFIHQPLLDKLKYICDENCGIYGRCSERLRIIPSLRTHITRLHQN